MEKRVRKYILSFKYIQSFRLWKEMMMMSVNVYNHCSTKVDSFFINQNCIPRIIQQKLKFMRLSASTSYIEVHLSVLT